MEQVLLHPNLGESVIKVEGASYHWDGALCRYRGGFGPFATSTKIGEWKPAPQNQARRILREIRA